MKGDGAAPPGADFTGCLWNAPLPGSPSRSLDPNSEMGWRAAPFRSSGDGTGVVARETWQARRQHPVQLVESFVDETQCRGTCYRACGFEAVGLTKGFARAGARETELAGPCPFRAPSPAGLLDRFGTLPGPWQACRLRHRSISS